MFLSLDKSTYIAYIIYLQFDWCHIGGGGGALPYLKVIRDFP